MTTLAIVGSGIGARSFLFALSQKRHPYTKILVFDSVLFSPPCSLTSTAIVAQRGVSTGHSTLGDFLLEGFKAFSLHVEQATPLGITRVLHYSGATQKLDLFKLRYPQGKINKKMGTLPLKQETFLASEEAFMVDPPIYLQWLFDQAIDKLPLEIISEFVTEVIPGNELIIRGQKNREYRADKILFATGAYTRWWKGQVPKSVLESSRPIQGAFLEFEGQKLDVPSFSLTLDGHNLIYHAHSQKLLIGSTTSDNVHSLPDTKELRRIHGFLKEALQFSLPEFHAGEIKVGHREKSRKREPYIITQSNVSFMGGFYKNGFTLGLYMGNKLLENMLREH